MVDEYRGKRNRLDAIYVLLGLINDGQFYEPISDGFIDDDDTQRKRLPQTQTPLN